MSNIKAFIHGVYPRSTAFVQTSRDVDRKRKEFSELKEQHKKDFNVLFAEQKSAKFDYVEDGKLNWQDVFRPIVDAASGMEVGPLTRWFDNNSFYRQPIITGKVKLDTKILDRFFYELPVDLWKVTLPSPFHFARVTDDTASKSFEKTLATITELYSDLLTYLAKKEVAFVQFNEPYIPYHKVKKTEIALLGKSLSQLKKVKGTMIFAVNGYFGDTTNLVAALSGNTAIDVLGIDFVHTSLTSLPKKLPHDIIAGVIEGRNSLLEDKKTLTNFIEKAVKYFQPKTLYISNNSDLDLLPESVAKEKIALLGVIRKEFQK